MERLVHQRNNGVEETHNALYAWDSQSTRVAHLSLTDKPHTQRPRAVAVTATEPVLMGGAAHVTAPLTLSHRFTAVLTTGDLALQFCNTIVFTARRPSSPQVEASALPAACDYLFIYLEAASSIRKSFLIVGFTGYSTHTKFHETRS
jgi:hypothetical protein